VKSSGLGLLSGAVVEDHFRVGKLGPSAADVQSPIISCLLFGDHVQSQATLRHSHDKRAHE
jgi:hypothetical protein